MVTMTATHAVTVSLPIRYV